jgi:hypothetical protein
MLASSVPTLFDNLIYCTWRCRHYSTTLYIARGFHYRAFQGVQPKKGDSSPADTPRQGRQMARSPMQFLRPRQGKQDCRSPGILLPTARLPQKLPQASCDLAILRAGAQGCKGARLQGDSLTILAFPAGVQGCKGARLQGDFLNTLAPPAG